MDHASPNLDPLKKSYRSTVLSSTIFVFTFFIYLGIVLFLKDSPTAKPSDFIHTLRPILYFLGLSMGFIIPFIRRVMLKPKNPDSSPPSDQPRSLQITGQLQTTTIVTMALIESICIYGLALFFVGKNPRDFYPLFLFALSLSAIYFPRLSFWKKFYQDRMGITANSE